MRNKEDSEKSKKNSTEEPEKEAAEEKPEKEKESRKTLAEQITAWVGILSVIVTIISAIVTIYLTVKTKLAEAEVNVLSSQTKADAEKVNETKEIFEREYKNKQMDLDSSKEKTERLKFVQTMLNDLSAKDEKKQRAIANLIRLVLKPEESASLFAGLEASTDETYQKIGSVGTEINNKTLEVAIEKEKEGFQKLIDGDYDNAARAFDAAENAYNSYHNVYELSRLIRTNKEQMKNDPAKKKEVFQKIVKDLSYGMPKEFSGTIKSFASQ